MTTLRQRITRALDARSHRGVAPGPHDIRIERDLEVPMTDGTVLLADRIVPLEADATLPTILIRGPYGRRGPLADAARMLAYEGYPVVFQSCRGTWGSAGTFTPQVDEQRDGIDTVRWLRAQPWFTGRLVMYGQSYMGYTQWAVAGRLATEEPALAPDAHIMLITMPDFGAVTWDNGAFSLRNSLGWTRMMVRMRKGGLALLGQALPDRRLARAFDVLPLGAGDRAAAGETVHWYQDWLRHESLADEYWTQQSHTASVTDVTAPIAMVTGWYDIFLPWQLRSHRRLVAAGNAPRLTLGPWGHVSPGLNAPAHLDTLDLLRSTFSDEPSTRASLVRAFQTGAEAWHDLEEWPPADAVPQAWFLHPDGTFGTGSPRGGTTAYDYDPQEPTPAVGGPSLNPDSGPVDNAAHESRADVAVFRGATLAAPLDVAGEPVARIRVRATAPSVDVFVRLTDVHPDGRSMTVCDGIRRVGSVATAASDPEPDADGFREVEVRLWPTFHRFLPGHRVSVQVSSGAHPRYSRNPGTGERALTAEETVVAHVELSHEGPHASRLELPVRDAARDASGSPASGEGA
ncbi:CocE/NonD family hydrolase [Demequina sp. SYSU T00192]|uniref:CocE/NonD family hydrolase n=1 Tax=Demequina litoralis TaxID=3051660 RepID=A0ABT8GCK1_9MICO|nr:CocE/NonD family hydrolase [Demequina sp. SYSU T00192]MDN4476865.1 CocE/NonD family hydrolase [Demequina sp. SYSU T00192]